MLRSKFQPRRKRKLRDNSPVSNHIDSGDAESELEVSTTVNAVPESLQSPIVVQPDHRRSIVHQHFTFNERSQRYCCKHCSRSYTKDKTSSTKSLRYHLTKVHSDKIPAESCNLSPNVQPRITQYVDVADVTEPFSKEGLIKRYVEYVVAENVPFQKAESFYFKRLIKFANPLAEIPGADAIRNRVRSLFLELKTKLTTKLQLPDSKISFVVDGWSSANRWSFLGIVARWIDENWKMNETVVDLTILEGSHSGENMNSHFVKTLKDFGIFNKIMAVTCDNASNMDTFCSHLERCTALEGIRFEAGNQRVRCLAHILNLCCQSILESLKQLKSAKPVQLEANEDPAAEAHSIIGKIREGIKAIRASNLHLETFRKQRVAQNVRDVDLIIDVKHRWNYTFYMLRRIQELKNVYETVLRSDAALGKFLLDADEWEKIDLVMGMLEKFEKMTIMISKEGVPSMSFCSMVYIEIYRHLERYLKIPARNLKGINPLTGQTYPDWIAKSAKDAYEKLDKYYPTTDGRVFFIATILDPCYKLEWYKMIDLRKEVITEYKRMIRTEWLSVYKPKQNSTPSSAAVSVSDDIYSQQMKLNCRNDDELESYLASKPVKPEVVKVRGVLGWWKDHEAEFPNLAKMARDYLAVFGTGVPVERIFSEAADVVPPKRRCMKPETLQETLCAKIWLHCRDKKNLGLAPASKIFECPVEDESLIETK